MEKKVLLGPKVKSVFMMSAENRKEIGYPGDDR